MSSETKNPKWWQLYVMLPLLVGLFWPEMQAHLTETEHIIAQLGAAHGFEHGLGGAGDGVRAQIDDGWVGHVPSVLRSARGRHTSGRIRTHGSTNGCWGRNKARSDLERHTTRTASTSTRGAGPSPKGRSARCASPSPMPVRTRTASRPPRVETATPTS